jgi:hypothetical protein
VGEKVVVVCYYMNYYPSAYIEELRKKTKNLAMGACRPRIFPKTLWKRNTSHHYSITIFDGKMLRETTVT